VASVCWQTLAGSARESWSRSRDGEDGGGACLRQVTKSRRGDVGSVRHEVGLEREIRIFVEGVLSALWRLR
jgi:hypothetical protein